MLAVPQAHYRVFHGDPATDSQHAARNDQFPSALIPRRVETSATDLHLREFAQLEVQVKALQIQSTNPGAVAGSLAECFLFYSRLFTPESFPWPDFLSAVCTKLAEHFATSENDVVRSAILRVFQRAKGHVAQVTDPNKLLTHLMGPLTHPTSITTRTLTLQMLATMPSLLIHDTTVQQQVIKGISAADHDERSAAIEAASAILPLSSSFKKDVLTLTPETETSSTCCLLADAVTDSTEAQQAWTRCAELYERLADDKSAVASLRAMTALTAAYPGVLLEMHGQLLCHVLDQDPRAIVRNFALLVTQQLVTKGSEGNEQLTCLLEGVFGRVASRSRPIMRITLSALLVLEKWSTKQEAGEKAKALLKVAKKLLAVALNERFGEVYTSILANIARQKLAAEETERSVDELLLLLHPRAPVAAKSTWNFTLAAIVQLTHDFPELLAAYVATRLIELLSIPADSSLDNSVIKARRTSLFKVLGAQFQAPSVDVIRQELPMLLKELSAISRTDAAHLRAVAATFLLWTQELMLKADGDKEISQTISDFERQLRNSALYESHAERYEMAKLAMLRGRFTLASQLLEIVAAKTDSECFGGWLHALLTLCEAEARITTDRSVHLQSLHSVARARMYLQAARTSSFRFDLQLHLLTLRLEWLQLVQSTQQLAGEAAYTNSPGNPVCREGQLSKQLRTLAHKFDVLRSLLLGADERDLDAPQAHANACVLLASAVDGFLLLRSSNSIDFPTKWGSCLWSLQVLKTLSEDVRGKLDRVVKLSPARQPGVGARVLQQLVAALCALPPVLPKLFFCSRLGSEQRLLSSAQFLTYAENTTFTAKPRSRSQLGVSLGTDFVSVLKGVLAVSRKARSYWSTRAEAVQVDVLVCIAGAAVNTGSSSIYGLDDGMSDDKLVQHRMTVTLPIAWDQVSDTEDQTMLYLPFETPVHVKAANLTVKGSFTLVAKLALVDHQDERWPLAATGCRRGFIVY
ncbi:hypothetical protein PInf_009289 [Phytophthora infestans]|nr:hypothetical protein PInf_009289 [Phytophthora infestans]